MLGFIFYYVWEIIIFSSLKHISLWITIKDKWPVEFCNVRVDFYKSFSEELNSFCVRMFAGLPKKLFGNPVWFSVLFGSIFYLAF